MPWQVEAWITSPTRLKMTLAERGLYFEMLNYQWKEGFVPDDQQAVAAHCGVPIAEVRRIWPAVRGHFSVLKNGTLRNTRMETIRRLKIGSYEVRSEKARKSVSVRWQKHKASNTTVIRTDTNREQRTENKNIEEKNPLPPSPDYDPSELVAWLVKEYPAHRQRGPWQHALSELIEQDHAAQRPAGYTETLIRANLPRFKLSQQWRDGKIENLANWLKPEIFMHPPPEHEGEQKSNPEPVNVSEIMRQRRERQGR